MKKTISIVCIIAALVLVCCAFFAACTNNPETTDTPKTSQRPNQNNDKKDDMRLPTTDPHSNANGNDYEKNWGIDTSIVIFTANCNGQKYEITSDKLYAFGYTVDYPNTVSSSKTHGNYCRVSFKDMLASLGVDVENLELSKLELINSNGEKIDLSGKAAQIELMGCEVVPAMDGRVIAGENGLLVVVDVGGAANHEEYDNIKTININ